MWLSSVEAKNRAVAKATTELTWMKLLLEELGFSVSGPIALRCDNQAAIHIANNPVFHGRTVHFELDCQFMREKVKEVLFPWSM